MSELKQWLDETSEADDFERSILRAGLEADPSAAKRDQVWSGLMGTLAVAPLVAATTSTQAASTTATLATASVSKATAVWLAVAKGFLVGLAVYGATAGVNEISNRLSARDVPERTAQRATAPRPTAKAVSEPASTASALPLSAASAEAKATTPTNPRAGASETNRARGSLSPATALPSVASFEHPEQPTSARVSQLEAETRALRLARDELRAGKLADAFATLEASRRQIPSPELYQEREALMIELLNRSGQVSAAEQRASAFLSRFPESPHAGQVRRFAASALRSP